MSQKEFLHTVFHTGRIVASPAALEVIVVAGQRPTGFLDRHLRGDRGYQ